MSDDPTPRELLIELRSAVKQIEALGVRLDSMTTSLERNYVPRGEYDAKYSAAIARLDTVEREADERERDRRGFQRQVMAGALVGGLMLLANIVVGLIRIPGVAQ